MCTSAVWAQGYLACFLLTECRFEYAPDIPWKIWPWQDIRRAFDQQNASSLKNFKLFESSPRSGIKLSVIIRAEMLNMLWSPGYLKGYVFYYMRFPLHLLNPLPHH